MKYYYCIGTRYSNSIHMVLRFSGDGRVIEYYNKVQGGWIDFGMNPWTTKSITEEEAYRYIALESV